MKKFKFTEEMHEWIKEDIVDIKKAIVLLDNRLESTSPYLNPQFIKIIEKFKQQLSAWEDRYKETKRK